MYWVRRVYVTEPCPLSLNCHTPALFSRNAMGAVSRLVDEVLTRNGTATLRRVEPEELEVCSRTKIPMLIDESVSDKLPKRDGAFQAEHGIMATLLLS